MHWKRGAPLAFASVMVFHGPIMCTFAPVLSQTFLNAIILPTCLLKHSSGHILSVQLSHSLFNSLFSIFLIKPGSSPQTAPHLPCLFLGDLLINQKVEFPYMGSPVPGKLADHPKSWVLCFFHFLCRKISPACVCN